MKATIEGVRMHFRLILDELVNKTLQKDERAFYSRERKKYNRYFSVKTLGIAFNIYTQCLVIIDVVRIFIS